MQLLLALYAITLGASSRFRLQFTLGAVVGVVWSGAYGYTLTVETLGASQAQDGFSSASWQRMTLVVLGALFLSHLAERYNRHVMNGEPFFEWAGQRGRHNRSASFRTGNTR